MAEEQQKSTTGLDALERAQIGEVVENRLMAFGLTNLQTEVHDAIMRIKVVEDKTSVIHKVLIDENSKDTVVSKVNFIMESEAKRTIADNETRVMRRQIMVSVIISILLSTGALLWQLSKL